MRKVTEQEQDARTTFSIEGAIGSRWRVVEIRPYMVTSEGHEVAFHAEGGRGRRRIVKVQLGWLDPFELKKLHNLVGKVLQDNYEAWKAVLP